MKNNAFTLTELIATIVILGILLVIGIPVYTRYINKTRNAIYDSYVNEVKDAAKSFVSHCISDNKCATDKDISFYENYNSGIRIKEDLVANKYIEKLVDPNGGGECDGTVYIDYDSSKYDDAQDYEYKICVKCGSNFTSSGCAEIDSLTRVDELIPDSYLSSDSKLVTSSSNGKFKIYGYSSYLTYGDANVSCSATGDGNEANCTISGLVAGSDKNLTITNSLNGKTVSKTFYRDATAPTCSDVTVSSPDVWTTSKTVTYKNISDSYSDSENKLYYSFDGGTTYTALGNSTQASKSFTSNTTVNFKIKDRAGNVISKSVALTKISNQKPTIVMNTKPDSSMNYQSFTSDVTVSSGTTGLSVEAPTFFLYDGTTLKSITPTLKTNNTDKKVYNVKLDYSLIKTTGTYYIVTSIVKNGVNKSIDSNLTVSGTNYYKLDPIKFNFTKPSCTISVTQTGSTKYPYLELVGNDTTETGAPTIVSKTWSTNETTDKINITANGTYTYTLINQVGLSGSCSKTVDNIDGSAPTISFSTIPACTSSNVNITVTATSKSTNLIEYKRTVPASLSKTNLGVKTFSETISFTSDTTSGKVTASASIQGLNSKITGSKTSGTIKIDKTKPNTPAMTHSSSNSHSAIGLHKTVDSGEPCSNKNNTTDNNSCKVTYYDPATTEDADIYLTIEGLDSGCGINYFEVSKDKSSWLSFTSSSKTNLDKTVKEVGSKLSNKGKGYVYIRSIDKAGNISPILRVELEKRISAVGW